MRRGLVGNRLFPNPDPQNGKVRFFRTVVAFLSLSLILDTPVQGWSRMAGVETYTRTRIPTTAPSQMTMYVATALRVTLSWSPLPNIHVAEMSVFFPASFGMSVFGPLRLAIMFIPRVSSFVSSALIQGRRLPCQTVLKHGITISPEAFIGHKKDITTSLQYSWCAMSQLFASCHT